MSVPGTEYLQTTTVRRRRRLRKVWRARNVGRFWTPQFEEVVAGVVFGTGLVALVLLQSILS